MPAYLLRAVLACAAIQLITASVMTPASADQSRPELDYAQDVQPLLARRCFSCHGPDQAEGGLAFHSAELALVESESGEYAIVPGDPEFSAMLTRVSSDDEYERMPPEGDPLTQSEIALLRQWIEEGATFTKHWAFEPLSDPAVPSLVAEGDAGADDDEVHPIDAFVLRRLADAGLQQAPPADKRTLIRRATYDLTGLPPTPDEVEAFASDNDPQAYEKLIDRLLASKQYGEKWGRHWLDLVRYAETNSFERDAAKPNVWKYRDYVIRSFNEDKPYDQFVQEQLAGDLFENPTTESLTATGYYRLGIWDDEPADPLQARYDELDDLVTTTGQAFLGLTINCARCHDHKIDPIPTTDYYGMLAIFADVAPYASRADHVTNNQIDITSPELLVQYEQCDEDFARIQKERTEIEQAGIVKMSAPDQRATEGDRKARNAVLREKLDQHLTAKQRRRYAKLGKELAQVKKRRRQLPPREQVLGLARKQELAETFVMFRGNPHSPTDAVTPRVPEIFENQVFEDSESAAEAANRRLEFANWVTTPDNRLTTRVVANRIWQHHFGRGIVRSTNNFGQLGTPPTHPELLDYLAHVFMDQGWKFKDMHRFMMTSQTYQAAATLTPEQAEAVGNTSVIDPNNDLFWRFDPRRLTAEEVRDTILTVAGTINLESYGPSFYEELSPEVLAGQSVPGKGWGDSDQSERNRRSVYIHVKRSLLTPLLAAFDFPEPDTTCEARFVTLQPGQAMSLLNSDFIHEKAHQLLASVREELHESGVTDEAIADDRGNLVRAIIQRVLGRDATDQEIAEGKQLMNSFINDSNLPPERAEALYALSVLNWNEFVFVF
ncbi:PSD1 and planctomycete cytochrome C domain-containing protein [Allorhodopirellula solitaria]|uniref:Planctomycete cytochrome C n=1 Tax=Allorhodopirellula solitaria TaxID=2527987 RepID=A0A5C5YKA7_9BACT|nr:PSD1 and planctomycete cytochrome C domain-containing protein [Allorhodopirellula solitaria]TWT75345.1 Planctomycete cytochrome C [Allorhodopirellula solitaria]